MKRYKVLSIGISVILFFALVAEARPAGGLQNRERLRENISTLRLLKMTQVLDLTEEQAAKIYPALTCIENEKVQIHKQMSVQIGELRALLKQEPFNDIEVEKMISSIKGLRTNIKAKDEEFENYLENNLTLAQKAKYVLFAVDFYRGLGEKLRRVRESGARSRLLN